MLPGRVDPIALVPTLYLNRDGTPNPFTQLSTDTASIVTNTMVGKKSGKALLREEGMYPMLDEFGMSRLLTIHNDDRSREN